MTKIVPVLTIILVVAGCVRPAPEPTEVDTAVPEPTLEVVVESEHQWTGVAVTSDGRIFVNFPRWWPEVPMSVAEVLADGTLAPYPDEAWNAWAPAADPKNSFVCVQSVFADGDGSLWILDPANPWFQGVVPGGAKLMEIDVESGEVKRVIFFDDQTAPAGSYLNDVRIDNDEEAAYITDSGMGALVVVDLATGESRRLLTDHPSTRSEELVLTIEGNEWLLPDGSAPQVHSDGIALDLARDLVYFQALTGRTLYRISAAALRDPSMSAEDLAARLVAVAMPGPSDGLLWDGDQGVFLSAIEHDAVRWWNPRSGIETVIEEPVIAWPDSFALGPDGALYVTTSPIHRGPNPPEPYRLLRITGF
jgi:sugar lactone lactonase YvrE